MVPYHWHWRSTSYNVIGYINNNRYIDYYRCINNGIYIDYYCCINDDSDCSNNHTGGIHHKSHTHTNREAYKCCHTQSYECSDF